MTTTTTDTLTRWIALWEQDDGLRPEFDGWKLVMWGREWSWICSSIYKDAPVGLVAMAIRDSAVRWLAEKGLQPTIDNEHPLGNPWAVVLADEIVEPEVIASDPSRVLIPGFGVNAVCHVPAACHPAPLIGRWKRDHAFFHVYHKETREPEGFQRWCGEWVRDVPDHEAYRTKLGGQLEELRIRGNAPSAPANYAAE